MVHRAVGVVVFGSSESWLAPNESSTSSMPRRSMRKHNAMAIAQKELIQSLKNLDPSTYFQVVFFDLKTHAMKSPPGREKLLRANPSNLHQAESFIKGILPEAGTDRFLAVSEALKFEPDAIFLLTDADEPEISAKELWDIQREQAESGHSCRRVWHRSRFKSRFVF